jgi:amino acid permease
MFGKRANAVGTSEEPIIDNDTSKTVFINDANVGSESTCQEEIRIVDEQEENNLSRSLGQRHIQMIALAGAIVRHPLLLRT